MTGRGKVQIYHYEEAVAKLFKKFLDDAMYVANYEIVKPSTSIEYIAEDINEKSPDLVFLALEFGWPHERNQGLEVLVKVRQKSEVPVVMVTSNSNYRTDMVNLVESKISGCNGYLVLPSGIGKSVNFADALIEGLPFSESDIVQ